MKSILLILTLVSALFAQQTDTVSFVKGSDLFKQQGIAHTVLGGSELGVAVICVSWMLFDMAKSDHNKMVHLYAGGAALALAFRGSWDIYLGRKNLIHFQYMRRTYPSVIRRLDPVRGEVYDVYYTGQ